MKRRFCYAQTAEIHHVSNKVQLRTTVLPMVNAKEIIVFHIF